MKHRSLALAACVLAACLLSIGGCSAGDAHGTNALLVTLDTTRRDALGCYGSEPAVTPHLDRIAAEGVVYENASATVPMTLPTHCSILTGLYPPQHTVRENALWPLPASAETLAETARAAGFETAAFVAAAVLDPALGIAQGFETYDSPQSVGNKGLGGERPGSEVTEAALAWMRARDRSRPFLLWVHYFDPHHPYEPPPAFRAGAVADDPYLGEVAATDAQVGRLLRELEAQGLLTTTAIVVVGDHGEAFGEHGEEAHGDFCYEPTIAVPLLVRHPNGARAGERRDELVSVVDVHPTLCDALGLGKADGLAGHSLWLGPPPAERGVYFESYGGYFAQGWSPLAGWRDREAKYLHSSDPELYDLDADPGESRNLVDERPDALRRYRLAISDVASATPLPQGEGEAVGEELLEAIRGLGYAALGGGYEKVPHPLAPSDRPSPRSMARWSELTVQGVELTMTGRLQEAEAIWERVLEANPLNFVALQHQAYCLMRQNRPIEAIAPLQTLLAEGPKKADWYLQLAVCLNRAGRNGEAIESLEQAIALDSGERYVKLLVQLLEQEGRLDEAATYARRLDGSR